jgi:hypothetical protein
MKRVVVRVYAGAAKTKGNPLVESTGFIGTALGAPGSSNLTDWTSGSTAPPATTAPAGGVPTTPTPVTPAPAPVTPPATPGGGTPQPE